MTDFSKLEARLDAALLTLGTGSKPSRADADALSALNGQVTDLKKESEERNAKITVANEQLEIARSKITRLREIMEEQKDSVAAQDKEAENLRTSQAEAITQRDKARDYTLQLKEANFELRKKNEEMVGDAELINRNLERDMAQLKEQHDLDLAEVNTILTRLTPLVEGN